MRSTVAASTAGTLYCIGKADAGWDKRLNDVYGRLKKSLDPAYSALLLTAQRSWSGFRRKDEAFAGGPWRANTRTLSQVTIASARLGGLRDRVLALETYESGD
jgi:uncharacterized protein YecT (DUF1311 family)